MNVFRNRALLFAGSRVVSDPSHPSNLVLDFSLGSEWFRPRNLFCPHSNFNGTALKLEPFHGYHVLFNFYTGSLFGGFHLQYLPIQRNQISPIPIMLKIIQLFVYTGSTTYSLILNGAPCILYYIFQFSVGSHFVKWMRWGIISIQNSLTHSHLHPWSKKLGHLRQIKLTLIC